MNGGRAEVSPETRALDALIKATIEHAEEHAAHRSSDTMLFLGNRHTSFPTLVVQDPILEPVDKLTWMAIRLQASETGGNTAFPSYAYIAKTANVSSTATISRAIAILRATRWLTLCARVRSTGGRFKGNVFALHDEPLPLVDAIHLDSTYMQFLRESAEHRHARVKAVAQGVINTIDEDINAGKNICTEEHPITRRMQATDVIEKNKPYRFFAFSAKAMTELSNPSSSKSSANHQGQNLNTVNRVQNLHPQNLKVSSGSSSYINITTTKKNNDQKIFEGIREDDPLLIYPKRLSDNQRELADRYLSIVPPDQRQSVLDELEGRIRSEQRGMTPLYDELSFLHALCNALRNGEFKFNLGIKVQEERIAREKERQKRTKQLADQLPDNKLQKLQQQIQAGKGSMAEIKKTLGMRDRPVKNRGSNSS